MQTLLLLMMLLTAFAFVLKQTFVGRRTAAATALAVCLFAGFAADAASEQSRTQIAAWMADQGLLLDMAVVLSVDVALALFFCITSVDLDTAEHASRRLRAVHTALRLYPGLLPFPVLFALLVGLLFALPGASFGLVGWTLGVAAGLLLPLAAFALRWLLPERAVRLELLFLVEVLLGLLGVVGTVSGTTVAAAQTSVDLKSLLAVAALMAVGFALGYSLYITRARVWQRRSKSF